MLTTLTITKMEIKFAFWGQGQFILFAACIYHRDTDEVKCKNFVRVTLENDYSCNVGYQLNNYSLL